MCHADSLWGVFSWYERVVGNADTAKAVPLMYRGQTKASSRKGSKYLSSRKPGFHRRSTKGLFVNNLRLLWFEQGMGKP